MQFSHLFCLWWHSKYHLWTLKGKCWALFLMIQLCLLLKLLEFFFQNKNSNTDKIPALIAYTSSYLGHSSTAEPLPLVCKFQQHQSRKHKPWLAKPGAVKSSVTLCRCRAQGELPYMLEFLFVWAWPPLSSPGRKWAGQGSAWDQTWASSWKKNGWCLL